MYDVKWIRENPEVFDKELARRGLKDVSQPILDLDIQHRKALTNLQEMQKMRNDLSMEISKAKKSGGNADELIAKVADIKDNMAKEEENVKELSEKLTKILSNIPNYLAPEVPFGKDDNDNKVIRTIGEPRTFDFEPKEHDTLGEALKMMDFANAAKLSGSRFVVLKGGLARLERAIAQFMLDTHTGEHGFTEINTPVMVKEEALYGTGQLPKFAEDLFKIEGGYWLIPTAEVTLTNLVSGEILEEEQLPLRYTGFTYCFRSEAGAAGKDTRGMIRQHQFEKVEMVIISHPDKSYDELEYMTGCAENILKKLKLPYRVMMLSSGDTGFSSHKTYDLEVWLPGQNRYREISSCSNCGEFQARRMNARFRKKTEKGTFRVHTLNGSGLAVGRTLIAVMENYQNADGSITVPEVLIPYMGGKKVIKADE
ncbi:MAG: serine--tRNA ligase [Alphaproteobacteria bacterium]